MKKLLVHVCCGPCSAHLLKDLTREYKVDVYFFNPNIYPKKEYEKRLYALKTVCETYGVAFMEGEYDHGSWLESIKGYEDEKEGGRRCALCFDYRLAKVSESAIGYDFFTTTLTVSPYKNSKVIGEIGKKFEKFLFIDFKKKDGFLKSCKASEDLKIYRQHYCGCEFSSIASPNEKKR